MSANHKGPARRYKGHLQRNIDQKRYLQGPQNSDEIHLPFACFCMFVLSIQPIISLSICWPYSLAYLPSLRFHIIKFYSQIKSFGDPRGTL